MVNGRFFVTLILLLLGACSAPRPAAVEAPLAMLPKQWVATELVVEFPSCATPRRVNQNEWWAFCDGQGAHGVLRRFGDKQQLLGTHPIPSVDRLAMADSVSKKSSWVEHDGHVYVGTEDGRLLMIDHEGVVRKAHRFADHTWIQHVTLMGDDLVILAARYQDVRVVRLDEDLSVQKEFVIGNALHDAEMVVDGQSIIVATDRGFLLELDRELSVKKLWRLSPGAALGGPRVDGKTVWVGSAEGRLYRVEREGDFSSVVLGKSSITSAPVATSAGVWVALDEEGALKLVDSNLEIRRVVQVPLARTLLSFDALSYRGHVLLGVASDRHSMLLSDEGEMLWQLKAQSGAHQLSARGKELWWGEWSLAPADERTPAGR